MTNLTQYGEGVLWDEVRHEYEITQISVRSLAQKFNVTLAQIEAKVAAEKWVRDTHKETMAIVSTKMVMGDRPENSAPITEKERLEAIEVAADRIVDVLEGHKRAARTGIEIVTTVLKRLKEADGKVKQYDMMGIAHDVDAVKEIKDLSTALKNYVGIDRSTYGLDDYKGLGSPTELARAGEEESRRRMQLIDNAMARALNYSTRHLKLVN